MTKYSMVSLPNGKKVRAVLNDRKLILRGVEVAQALGYSDPELVIRRECSDFDIKRIELDGIPADCLFISAEDVQRLMLLDDGMDEAGANDWLENYVRPMIQALDYEYRSLVARLKEQGFIREGRTFWGDEKKEEPECK